jgi:adenosylhomocysteine nucleosidase
VIAGAQPWVAVVTGLRAEARCLRKLAVRVACSGGSSERARLEAARLVAEGAAALVSFGLAGGLARDLRPGALLLPESVRSPDGRSIPTDPRWRERLWTRLRRRGLAAAGDAVAGSDQVVATAAAKRGLHATAGAGAVDMESHAIAAVASDAGVPFLILRAIADPYDRAIPQAALETVMPDGRVRVLAVLGGVIREPGQLIALVRLGRDTAAALATLRRAATLAGPDLSYDGKA